jgi:hypothetical protein
MKAAEILLATSLFMATQAFAWGEREQNVLLGFGAGLLVSHIAEMHKDHRTGTTYTYGRPRGVLYVHPKRHQKREYHNRCGRGHHSTFGR